MLDGLLGIFWVVGYELFLMSINYDLDVEEDVLCVFFVCCLDGFVLISIFYFVEVMKFF